MAVNATRKAFTLLSVCAGNPQPLVDIVSEAIEASTCYPQVRKLSSELEQYPIFSDKGKEMVWRIQQLNEMNLQSKNVADLYSLEPLFAKTYQDFQKTVSESNEALAALNFPSVHIVTAYRFITLFRDNKSSGPEKRKKLYEFLERSYPSHHILSDMREFTIEVIRSSEEYNVTEKLHEYLFLTDDGKELEERLKIFPALVLENTETKELLQRQERAQAYLTQFHQKMRSALDMLHSVSNVHVIRQVDLFQTYLHKCNLADRARIVELLKPNYPSHELIKRHNTESTIIDRLQKAMKNYLASYNYREKLTEKTIKIKKQQKQWQAKEIEANRFGRMLGIICIFLMAAGIFIKVKLTGSDSLYALYVVIGFTLFFLMLLIFSVGNFFIYSQRIGKQIENEQETLDRRAYAERIPEWVYSLTDDEIIKALESDGSDNFMKYIVKGGK